MGDVLNFPSRLPIPNAHADVESGGSMPWRTPTKDYIQSLLAAGRSRNTARIHSVYLRSLATICPTPWDVTRTDIEAWLASHPWAPETRRTARSVVIGFYRWAVTHQFIPASPADDLLTVHVPPTAARPTPEQVFHDAMERADHRMRHMLMLGRYAGLRAAEIAQVHSHDLADDLLYVTGKGGKRRIVPLAEPELVHAIMRAQGWLFPSPNGGHVTANYVSILVSRHLPEGWTAHTLRHSFASHAYAGSHDLLALAQVLGHSSPATTQRYVSVHLDSLRAVAASAA